MVVVLEWNESVRRCCKEMARAAIKGFSKPAVEGEGFQFHDW